MNHENLEYMEWDGVLYVKRLQRCGKNNCTGCPHGPYWFALHETSRGKIRSVYCGRFRPGTPEFKEYVIRLQERRKAKAISVRSAVETTICSFPELNGRKIIDLTTLGQKEHAARIARRDAAFFKTFDRVIETMRGKVE